MRSIKPRAGIVVFLGDLGHPSPVRLDAWRRKLETRLDVPVLLCGDSDSERATEFLCQAALEFAGQGVTRIVLLPLGAQPLETRIARDALAWLRLSAIEVEFLEANPLTRSEIADWVLLTIDDFNQVHSVWISNLILVGKDPSCGESLVTTAFWLRQAVPSLHIDYAFLDHGVPQVALPRSPKGDPLEGSTCILSMSMDESQTRWLQARLETLLDTSLSAGDGWVFPAETLQPIGSIDWLDAHELINIVAAKYFNAFDNKPLSSVQVPDTSDYAAQVTEQELRNLEARMESMLPDEYRGKLDEVSPQSMGSAKITTDAFGTVPWDQIWTSFCDLAMAGGPPHRGKLLEAVPGSEVEQDLQGYQQVVREIERGIRLTTGLKTVPSSALGWVGMECEDAKMASWLLRAIIVENVMVRREENVLYLPAGPRFKVRREIKNVITSVAKTVHYWQAHLRFRNRQSDN